MTRTGVFSCVCEYFNSHPHEEDDFIRRSLLGTFIYFNSHPHEEDDYRVPNLTWKLGYFNSHPHEEDDSFETGLAVN